MSRHEVTMPYIQYYVAERSNIEFWMMRRAAGNVQGTSKAFE